MDTKLRYAIVAACVLGASGQPSAETRPRQVKKVLKGSLLSQPTTLDPVKARSHAELTLSSLLFDTLYTIDLDGKPVPHLALGLPEVTGKTARITLYPGVVFHNDAALGAGDVVSSLRRLADDSGAGWLLEPIETIRRDGDDVVLDLRRDTAELAVLLSSPRTAITRKGRAPTLSRATGTGPFRLDGSVKKHQVELTRFDKHFGGPPFVRGLTLRWFDKLGAEAKAYEAGDSHLSLRGAVAFAGHKPKFRTKDVEGPAVTLTYVGFGKNRKVLRKLAFRRAVSLAVSRNSLRNIGSGEKVVPTIYPAAEVLGGPATHKAARKANRPKATALVADLKVGSGALEVLVDRTRLDDRAVGQKLVAALLKIGLNAKLSEVGAKELASRVRSGKCDLYIGQLSPVSADPSMQFADAFAVAKDSWAKKQLRTAPLNPVWIVGKFDTRLPIVPLFHRAVRVHHRSDVRGAELDVLSRLSYADLRVYGRPRRSKP